MAALTHTGLKQTVGKLLILCVWCHFLCVFFSNKEAPQRAVPIVSLGLWTQRASGLTPLLSSCERRHPHRLSTFRGRQDAVTRGDGAGLWLVWFPPCVLGQLTVGPCCCCGCRILLRNRRWSWVVITTPAS